MIDALWHLFYRKYNQLEKAIVFDVKWINNSL